MSSVYFKRERGFPVVLLQEGESNAMISKSGRMRLFTHSPWLVIAGVTTILLLGIIAIKMVVRTIKAKFKIAPDQKEVRWNTERQKASKTLPTYTELQKLYNTNKDKLSEEPTGKTKVLLGERVVFKHSEEFCSSRLSQMDRIRKILEQENLSHLIIPRAAIITLETSELCRDVLVEERLPISSSYEGNVYTYLANKKAFTPAIKEMVKLFSLVTFTDLVEEQNEFSFRYDARIPFVPRYDNLPLYITGRGAGSNAIGKLGLIDLDDTEFVDASSKVLPNRLDHLVTLFPYHKDIIIDEAKKMKVMVDVTKMDRAEKVALQNIQRRVLDHINWVEAKSKSSDADSKGLAISEAIKSKCTALFTEELKKHSFCVSAAQVEILMDQIQSLLTKRITDHQSTSFDSFEEIRKRSLTLPKSSFYKGTDQGVILSDTIKRLTVGLGARERNTLIESLVVILLHELKSQDKIFKIESSTMSKVWYLQF
ncbi:MAG: hypothetical protein SP4CHLAM5_02900 [Chlamydiia bacterium]|nr:hypothetical protein [Chlamydiia bacterium]MCH9618164.1 hypothetical protein [Chlamydiia bacterium]MCH9624474.1 hypothetical protein [Chlamydiia bacterium]